MEVIRVLSNGSVLSRPGSDERRPPVKRHKRTQEELEAIAQEALGRAESGTSIANYATILGEFNDRGIPLEDISPRDNVLTYHAWLAKGRQVRRGEKGVKITVWKAIGQDDDRRLIPGTAAVFHISQTDEVKP